MPPFLDVAVGAWRAARPDLAIARVEVVQHPDYTFDLAALDAHAGRAVFVAIDHRYLNFKRLELRALLAARGCQVEAIVARTAVIDEGATVAPGAFVGEGAVVGPGATIREAAYIGARAVIGPQATIERGAWLDAGVVVGVGATVGAQTVLGSGVVVADRAEVGELGVVAVPGLLRGEIPARTYRHPAFHEPIRVYR